MEMDVRQWNASVQMQEEMHRVPYNMKHIEFLTTSNCFIYLHYINGAIYGQLSKLIFCFICFLLTYELEASQYRPELKRRRLSGR